MKQRIVSAGFPQERTPARSRRSFRGFRTTAPVSPPPHAGPVQPPPPQPIAGTDLRTQVGLLCARGHVCCVLMLVAIYCWVPAGADVCTTQKIVSAGPPRPPPPMGLPRLWSPPLFPHAGPGQPPGNRRCRNPSQEQECVRWVPAGVDACTKRKIVPRLPDQGVGLSPSPRSACSRRRSPIYLSTPIHEPLSGPLRPATALCAPPHRPRSLDTCDRSSAPPSPQAALPGHLLPVFCAPPWLGTFCTLPQTTDRGRRHHARRIPRRPSSLRRYHTQKPRWCAGAPTTNFNSNAAY